MTKQLEDFMRLFRGRVDAYGTGKGEWKRQPLNGWQYQDHLDGKGYGLGVAPLMDDGRVWFAAVDLDEPDFEAAAEMARYITIANGVPWIERSRSGNAHIWAFFSRPVEAWIPRGLMRDATEAVGKPTVEVFPKQDKLLEGMVGNYINLPYHGDGRPMLWSGTRAAYPIEEFLAEALTKLNDPEEWRKRCKMLMIQPPEEREGHGAEFGTGKELHCCATYLIANRDEVPVREGHRNVVYFALAKMLAHYEGVGHDETLELMKLVRDSATQKGEEHYPDRELERNLRNAERGGFTSTSCDDPLFQPYADPECSIANA